MSAPTPPPLVVLSGATGTGKTALAVHLARALDAELVGADSVQVYRGFDVGSAKPAAAELQGVPHHLLDVVDPHEPFDAGRFRELADASIAEIQSRGRVALVVGGTGLYLRALVWGLAQGIPSEPALREQLNARAAQGPEALARMHAELALVDPEYARKVHPTDPIRVVRGLEVHALTGTPLSEHHARHAAQPPRYRALWLCLDVPRDALRERQRARVDAMLAAGWVDEVRGLLARGVDPTCRPLRAVGYAQVLEHVQGKLEAAAMREQIVNETWAFTRRQRNWFRAERGVTWESPERLREPAWSERIAAFARGEEASTGYRAPA